MPRSRPTTRPAARRRQTPPRPATERFGTSRTMKIGFIVLATLFTCSLLAGSLVLIPFDELFGLNDEENAQNIPDPNDDLIEEQVATVEANPDDVDAVLLLANVMANSGRLDEAIPYYEQAIDFEPDDPSIRLDFARSLADGGLHQDAELQFVRTLELDTDRQEAHYYLGELYMNWEPQRTEEAIERYQATIELGSGSFVAELARNRLVSLGATPLAGATPDATPATAGTDGS